MDVELPIEFSELREVTRRLLMSRAPLQDTRRLLESGLPLNWDRWRELAESGWTSMLAAEPEEGDTALGDAVIALGVFLQQAGRVLLPDPVRSANLFGWAIVTSGTAEQRGSYLPALSGGEIVGVWVPDGRCGSELCDVTAQAESGGFVLSGIATPVPDVGMADVALVTARTASGPSQFVVPLDTHGVERRPLTSMDLTRGFCELRFDGVLLPREALVGEWGGAERACAMQTELATALLCAEMVGAMDALYEETLAYAKERKAFGRSIGSFQVIKHRLVDMLLWLEESKAVTLGALRAVADASWDGEQTSIAKLHLSQRGPALARMSLQIFGGVGFTWESDVHLYLRYLESSALLCGDAMAHMDGLAGVLSSAWRQLDAGVAAR